jgi:2-oxoglutarate ferredoxin oxidoreductase subunit delta
MSGSRQAEQKAAGPAQSDGSRAGGPAAPGARPRRRPPEILLTADLCKSCGICIKLCPHGVFSADAEGRPVVTDLDACTSCRFCEQHCPDFALEIRRAEKDAVTPPVDLSMEDDEGDE